MKARARIIILAATAITGALSAAGCYERVVGARGPGADTMKIEQPNVPAPEGRTLGYPKYQHKAMPGG
jgi:hypothetical protein